MPANVPARPKDELDTKRTFTLAKCPMCKKAGGRKCFGCGLSGRRITQRESRRRRPAVGVAPRVLASLTCLFFAALAGEKEELGPRLAKGKKKAEAGEPDKAAAADEKVDGEKAVDEALKPGLMFRCSKLVSGLRSRSDDADSRGSLCVLRMLTRHRRLQVQAHRPLRLPRERRARVDL